jgi:CRP/FNR family transcriptional regulator
MLSSTSSQFDKTAETNLAFRIAGRQTRSELWSTLEETLQAAGITASHSRNKSHALFQHVRLKAGQRAYRIGHSLESIYLVNWGFLKTISVNDLGDENTLRFPMKGDVLGAEGLGIMKNVNEVIAISDCELIRLPYKKLIELASVSTEIRSLMHSTLSRETVRNHQMLSMLVNLTAEGRLAKFVVLQSERFESLGYSKLAFTLRMKRQDIASYLHLTLETVSRSFSALQQKGVLLLDKRSIDIIDLAQLKQISQSVRYRRGGGTNTDMNEECSVL